MILIRIEQCMGVKGAIYTGYKEERKIYDVIVDSGNSKSVTSM